jgi:hypothetical protein
MSHVQSRVVEFAMTTMALEITTPGVYDMPFDVYLADPVPGGSLSTSGAKTLLNSCPAIFAYEREHGRPEKAAFDFGHAAHSEVLGDGMRIVVVDADDWRTKAAREARDQAYAEGATPLLRKDYQHVQAMGDALRAHPVAGKLLDPGRGTPEQSLFWTDERTGVWRRARLDSLPHPGLGRMIVVDYKSTDSAKPAAFAKSVAAYGYDMQGAAYIDGIKTLGLAEDVAFLLIAQEKTAPYLISVFEPSASVLRIGAERNAKAIDLFKRCTERDEWPAYVDAVELIDLPLWAERQWEQEIAS